MDRAELIRDMKQFSKSSFITKKKLADYMDISDPQYVQKYVADLERVDNKYYFIPDVASVMKSRAVV